MVLEKVSILICFKGKLINIDALIILNLRPTLILGADFCKEENFKTDSPSKPVDFESPSSCDEIKVTDFIEKALF